MGNYTITSNFINKLLYFILKSLHETSKKRSVGGGGAAFTNIPNKAAKTKKKDKEKQHQPSNQATKQPRVMYVSKSKKIYIRDFI